MAQQVTLGRFIQTYTGQRVRGGQCGELVRQYWIDVDQTNPPSYANSKDYWFNPVPGYDKVSTPQPGDIAIYNGHGGYPEGHSAIYVDGCVFEQNADPDGSPAHLFTRNSPYLLGYLRKQGAAQDMATPAQIDEWISAQYQIAFGQAPPDAVFADWRSVLSNNFVDGSISILKGIDANDGALKNEPTPKQVGDIYKFMTGTDISQKDLDFYITPPRTIYDLVYALAPTTQKARDTVQLLENDRDKNLYPLIEKDKADIADLTRQLADALGKPQPGTVITPDVPNVPLPPVGAPITQDQTNAVNSIIKFIRTVLGIK